MEVFRNLYINLIEIPADKFIGEVADHLKSIQSEWHRDTEQEENNYKRIGSRIYIYTFLLKILSIPNTIK